MKKFLWIYLAFSLFYLVMPILTAQPWKDKEAASLPREVTVLFSQTGEEKTVPLEEYIACVVAAEMPASFEIEALKAQAVAARTYTVCHFGEGTHPGHPNADTCTDPNHCKAYKSEQEAKSDWGADGTKNWAKITAAVKETKGEIITYEGDPIDAVFHSASAGHTADAADVWQASVPYLVSVESTGEESSPDYQTTVTVPLSEFRENLRAAYPEIPEDRATEIGEVDAGESGYVRSVLIGGQAVKGTELRRLFSLRSTAFTLSVTDQAVIFSVTGHGHGVGMSQYGANAMAKEGADYRKILETYYQKTEIERR